MASAQSLNAEGDPTGKNTYRLSPIDQIEVKVYRQEDMTTLQRIDQEGNITLPLLGSVQVGGLSVPNAESRIAQAYVDKRYLRDPSISISVEEYAPKAITVLGEVREAGEVILPMEANAIPLTRAIALAGGFTDLAKRKKIQVVRKIPGRMEVSYEVDIRDQLDADSANETIQWVYPGDTIVVPERLF